MWTDEAIDAYRRGVALKAAGERADVDGLGLDRGGHIPELEVEQAARERHVPHLAHEAEVLVVDRDRDRIALLGRRVQRERHHHVGQVDRLAPRGRTDGGEGGIDQHDRSFQQFFYKGGTGRRQVISRQQGCVGPAGFVSVHAVAQPQNQRGIRIAGLHRTQVCLAQLFYPRLIFFGADDQLQ